MLLPGWAFDGPPLHPYCRCVAKPLGSNRVIFAGLGLVGGGSGHS